MIPVVEIPPTDANGQYCAGRSYRWFAANCEDSDFILWEPTSMPDNVDWDDVIQSNPTGAENYITVPVSGRYCFGVSCGIAIPA